MTVFYIPRQTKHRPIDALFINIITQALISRKITRQKEIIIGRRKSGPAKTIFGQKSGPAMAGPAVLPTTALIYQQDNLAGFGDLNLKFPLILAISVIISSLNIMLS